MDDGIRDFHFIFFSELSFFLCRCFVLVLKEKEKRISSLRINSGEQLLNDA